jgi:uncharacterized protein YqfA (UPF0365 family)
MYNLDSFIIGQNNPLALGALIVVGIIVVLFFLFLASFLRLWLQAYFSRANIKFSELVGMRLRKVDAKTIVLSKITAIQAGLDLTTKDLESHYLAGGRVPNVVRALIAANRANIALTLKTATAIDLAGRDILDAVTTSVKPKVIDCPDPTKGKDTTVRILQKGKIRWMQSHRTVFN